MDMNVFCLILYWLILNSYISGLLLRPASLYHNTDEVSTAADPTTHFLNLNKLER